MYAFDTSPPRLNLRSLVQLCEMRFGWDLQEILWKCKHYVWPAVALRLAVKAINPDHEVIHTAEIGMPLVSNSSHFLVIAPSC